MREAEQFQAEVGNARLHVLKHELHTSEQSCFSEQRPKTRHSIWNKMQLYVPVDGRKVVAAIIINSSATSQTERLIFDDTGRMKALQSHWRPVFADKVIDEAFAEKWIGEAPGRQQWDWSATSLPEPSAFLRILEQCIDTGTGPDGIPYSALAAAGMIAAQILWEISKVACSQGLFPWGFNDNLQVFLPKDLDEQ
eukprot:3887188-Karenia_brevis.AAC.1